ncbi:Hypothetical predicted protein [Lecanosticta acicola]|uniref:Life-span regulatory factor domain-containing protein n=1 Tax=Lecanosticta acicola TaxID=111012 RepID=A0AAI8Z4Q0_9PEZI|nr:Hypothetical predicted protein [Lecanosticta acicola]
MSKHQHARSSSQGGRKALPPHARPTKPPPLRRGASYNYTHHHGQPSPKAGAGWSKKVVGTEEAVHFADEEEVGMASFLQFCATCEKQIVTPGSSILYCSEACRKKDTSRPTSVQSIESVKSPSGMFNNNAASYFESHPPADILPQRSPTVLRPLSCTFSDMSISDSNPYSLDDAASDASSRKRDSEATAYLEQFYSDFARASRPRMHRAHTTTTDSSTIPSLVHSPSSSYGTVASNASYRPLANRHNPYTTSFSTNKSIDLVLPYHTTIPHSSSPNELMKDASHKSSASTLTSFRVAEAGDISYEKKKSPTSRRGPDRKAEKTLKHLFNNQSPT